MAAKLIAFDLDNTFLDSEKKITGENLRAIKAAINAGIEIVPATGRLFKAVPQELKELCRYFIVINGAKIYDAHENKVIHEALIPKELALELYDHGDTLDCIYDAYIDDCGIMNSDMRDIFTEFMPDRHYAEQMKTLRLPVRDLKEYIISCGRDVQKSQYFFRSTEEKDKELKYLTENYPMLKSSSSLGQNIEINYETAGKGIALEALCSHLGISLNDTVAFGDETNDIELITYAGCGYCMKNGSESVKKIADRITEYGCNESGVAREIFKLL